MLSHSVTSLGAAPIPAAYMLAHVTDLVHDASPATTLQPQLTARGIAAVGKDLVNIAGDLVDGAVVNASKAGRGDSSSTATSSRISLSSPPPKPNPRYTNQGFSNLGNRYRRSAAAESRVVSEWQRLSRTIKSLQDKITRLQRIKALSRYPEQDVEAVIQRTRRDLVDARLRLSQYHRKDNLQATSQGLSAALGGGGPKFLSRMASKKQASPRSSSSSLQDQRVLEPAVPFTEPQDSNASVSSSAPANLERQSRLNELWNDVFSDAPVGFSP